MPSAFGPEEAARIREALLRVGYEHLARTGFRKTSVDTLVRAAGISKGSFYLFFPSKLALWMELLNAAEQQMRERLMTLATAADEPPQGRLRAVLHALFDAVTRHPLLRALADPTDMAWLLRALPKGTFEQSRQDDRRFFAKLHDALRERGAVGSAVSSHVFGTLPVAALALAQGRPLFDEQIDEFAAVIGFQVEAWAARLRANTPINIAAHAIAEK